MGASYLKASLGVCKFYDSKVDGKVVLRCKRAQDNTDQLQIGLERAVRLRQTTVPNFCKVRTSTAKLFGRDQLMPALNRH